MPPQAQRGRGAARGAGSGAQSEGNGAAYTAHPQNAPRPAPTDATMQGLWLEEKTLRFRDDLAIPEPPPGEARIRVRMAGICGTDVELTRGYYPYAGVPGHEFVGEVADGPEALLGRRVVGEINAACGLCPACAAGRQRHCPRRTVLGIVNRGGAFAEYLTLPVSNLHVIPDEVSDEAAVFVEPLAAALEIGEQVPLTPGQRALVIGDGRLGQLVARVLALSGCHVTAAGRHESKLSLLTAAGVHAVAAAALAGPEEAAAWDLVVECTGTPAGFAAARRAVRPRGTLVMKSTYADPLTFDASALVVDEVTLLGSRCGPFAPALRLIAGGQIDPLSLVSAVMPLREGEAAFEKSQAPGVLKVLLDMRTPEPDSVSGPA